ncbi:MAG: hypothetical protein CVU90_07180 [Firmicutes bacterium HGW-Firmicutes-15]|nr:MAG: hypothetical protein CVU90_07180 [Firmicutes bacterium HGW-Firmicutes-15]
MDLLKKDFYFLDDKYQVLSNYNVENKMHFRNFIVTKNLEPFIMFDVAIYENIAEKYEFSPSVLLLEVGIKIFNQMLQENNFSFSRGFISEHYPDLSAVNWQILTKGY